jgi:predicted HicB family RNase H-like nuclease
MKKYEEITINFDKEVLYQLMLLAHQQNITLNQLIENVLKDFIKENK